MQNLLSPFKKSLQRMFGWSLQGSLLLLNNLLHPISEPLQYAIFFSPALSGQSCITTSAYCSILKCCLWFCYPQQNKIPMLKKRREGNILWQHWSILLLPCAINTFAKTISNFIFIFVLCHCAFCYKDNEIPMRIRMLLRLEVTWLNCFTRKIIKNLMLWFEWCPKPVLSFCIFFGCLTSSS